MLHIFSIILINQKKKRKIARKKNKNCASFWLKYKKNTTIINRLSLFFFKFRNIECLFKLKPGCYMLGHLNTHIRKYALCKAYNLEIKKSRAKYMKMKMLLVCLKCSLLNKLKNILGRFAFWLTTALALIFAIGRNQFFFLWSNSKAFALMFAIWRSHRFFPMK